MDLKTVLCHLSIREHEAAFSPDWEASQKARPGGPVGFLTPEYVAWACKAACLPQDITQAVLTAARRITADDALSALAWWCHHSLFRVEGKRPEVHKWPLLTAALDRDAGMFYVLVLLSGTPRMQAAHEARKIPADIRRATALDLKRCMTLEDYPQEFGAWGITPRFVNWLMNHWRGHLYSLGRLQFIPSVFRGRVRAFRHRASRTVVALSEAGVRYRADGQIDGAGGVLDKEAAWTSSLTITDHEIVGHPIAPTSYAMQKPLRLPANEWKQVLAPGDPVLDIHIPTGGPMDFQRCGESIHQALDFFPRHFPDKPFVAIMCHSWILDAQFERLLPPTSNLVRFQKEVYLFPIAGSSEGVLRLIFGLKHYKDLAHAPRKTTMQRAFARHVESGGHFRGGGCFLFPEDLNWGSQFYRRQALPWQ
ncbi:MAG: hypothetical protein FJ279_25540 [Planctomycetes bacterium]|nr:hypothetical protein [Planctomycetota bacterium]